MLSGGGKLVNAVARQYAFTIAGFDASLSEIKLTDCTFYSVFNFIIQVHD